MVKVIRCSSGPEAEKIAEKMRADARFSRWIISARADKVLAAIPEDACQLCGGCDELSCNERGHATRSN